MARKTVRVSDVSGQEIPDGKGAIVRITSEGFEGEVGRSTAGGAVLGSDPVRALLAKQR